MPSTAEEASIPAFLGTTVPILGFNPYSVTKTVYTNAVKPIAKPLVPHVAPVLTWSLAKLSPISTPLLASVGLTEFKSLQINRKGNTVIAVRPEGGTQTIIGGKVSEEQEFDYFVARVCETAKCLKVPDRFSKKKGEEPEKE